MISATHEGFLATGFQEAEPQKCCRLRVTEAVGLGRHVPALTLRGHHRAQQPNGQSAPDLRPRLRRLAGGS